MIRHNALELIWKQAVMNCFKVKPPPLAWYTEKNREKNSENYDVALPRAY